jgi:hypothetical protein
MNVELEAAHLMVQQLIDETLVSLVRVVDRFLGRAVVGDVLSSVRKKARQGMNVVDGRHRRRRLLTSRTCYDHRQDESGLA